MESSLYAAQKDLAKYEAERSAKEMEEGSLWDELANLHGSRKAVGVTAEEKTCLDARARTTSIAAAEISIALTALQQKIESSREVISVAMAEIQSVRTSLEDVVEEIETMKVEFSCVRLQKVFDRFPTSSSGMLPLKTNSPCVRCGMFWVDMALANLPCGCLLHPKCMFATVLAKDPLCPGCGVVPGVGWRGQWRFAAEYEVAAAALAVTAMRDSGWGKPRSRVQALVSL